MNNIRIMSFNTQHCRNFISKKIDFEAVAKAITDFDADIVGLNEIRGQGEHPEYTPQTEMLSELTEMKYYYFAKAIDLPDGLYGNAILSKRPIIKAETVMIPDPNPRKYKRYYETRCVLKAELEGGLTVLVTHFGLNPDEQENAVKTVLENISKEKCVLMGDFNVIPDSELLDPIRKTMQDSADMFDRPLSSFPSDNPDRKIDYIFVSKDTEIVSADIPEVVVSDHRPYTAILKIKSV